MTETKTINLGFKLINGISHSDLEKNMNAWLEEINNDKDYTYSVVDISLVIAPNDMHVASICFKMSSNTTKKRGVKIR